MTKMTEALVEGITGRALAWAVWLAERGEPGEPNPATGYIWTDLNEHWSPATDWSQVGPLIQKYGIEFEWITEDTLRAEFRDGSASSYGHSHQVAVCRAVVKAKFGFKVRVPTYLLEWPL